MMVPLLALVLMVSPVTVPMATASKTLLSLSTNVQMEHTPVILLPLLVRILMPVFYAIVKIAIFPQLIPMLVSLILHHATAKLIWELLGRV